MSPRRIDNFGRDIGAQSLRGYPEATVSWNGFTGHGVFLIAQRTRSELLATAGQLE